MAQVQAGPHAGLDSPARQVLNNQELVGLVVDAVYGRQNELCRTNKKILATLATLNKAFFHATTEVLWGDVPSLSPFLRLLPLFPSDDRAESELTMKLINNRPWSRFLLYNRKVTHLELRDDKEIGKAMPNHWFFSLFHHPTRPSSLFPRLSELVISSVAGLNSVIPFHIAHGLQRVTFNDITKNGAYEGQTQIVTMSLMTSLACTSTALKYLVMLSPVSTSMTGLLSKYSALTFLSLSLPSQTPTETFASIGTLPSLRGLQITSQKLASTPVIPLPGQHLNKHHPMQGTSRLRSLGVNGDASFVYWVTLFFASPSLSILRAEILKTDARAARSVFLVPHIIDLLGRNCLKLEEISFRSQASWTDEDARSQLVPWVNEQTFQPPPTVFQSFAKLTALRRFTFSNIPCIKRDFAHRLLSQLTEMKRIAFLSVEPLPLTSQPQHTLILPGLDILRDISVNHPRLRYLYITLDMSAIPAPSNDIVPALPGHPLEQLFITPKGRTEPFEVSELIVIATYLDRLFPNLVDIKKTHFWSVVSEQELNSTGISAHTLWRDVDPLLKSFQAMRKQYAAAATAAATAGPV